MKTFLLSLGVLAMTAFGSVAQARDHWHHHHYWRHHHWGYYEPYYRPYGYYGYGPDYYYGRPGFELDIGR